MQQRSGISTTGEDELTQWRQFRFKHVDCFLQRLNALLWNLEFPAALSLGSRIRKLRSDRKEILLDVCEHSHKRFVFQERYGGAEMRIQFVHVAVGFHAIVVFTDFRAVEQARIAFVAGLGIDLHASFYSGFALSARASPGSGIQ